MDIIAKIKHISIRLQHQYLVSIALSLTTLIVSGCSSSSSKEAQESPDLPVKDSLVLHLEATTGIAVEEGIVTGWIDNSLQGNHLLSAGDPTLMVNSLNGQSTVHFDGEGDKLEHTVDLQGLPTGNEDRTVFMVAKYNSNGFGGFAYGKPANNNAFGLVVDSEGYLAVQAWGKENDRQTKVDGNGSDWLTQSAKLEAGNLTQYKDGIQLNSAAHNYNTTAEQLVVGAEIGNRTYVDMEVAEIIVFDEALNEAKRKQVESYLQQKYFL